MLDLTFVYFNSEGDGMTALYIDGALHCAGDYYHDKIDEYLAGFVDGLKYNNSVPFVQKSLYIEKFEDEDEYFDFPLKLEQLPKQRIERT